MKAHIVAARNKLRAQAVRAVKDPARCRKIHKEYEILAACHRKLGFGKLDNIREC
jgi:hypothetical protein